MSPITCSRASRFMWRAGSRHAATTTKDGKKQYFTEVVAEEAILLGGRGGDGGEGTGPVSQPRTAQRSQPAEESPMDQGITDDDVPF